MSLSKLVRLSSGAVQLSKFELRNKLGADITIAKTILYQSAMMSLSTSNSIKGMI